MATKHKKTVFFILLLLFLILPIAPASAKKTQDCGSSFIPCECLDDTASNCGLIEFAQLFANLYSFSLKYLGALALLMFIIGGVMFMVSGGNQERITTARHILVGTTIGIFIVLSSYLMVDYFQKKLLGVKSDYRLPGSDNSLNECQEYYGESGGGCFDVCPEGWTPYDTSCGYNSNQSCCVPPSN